MATRMQQRRATAEQWLLADPILAAGEIGYETDTRSFKIGDGINTFSLLDYFENTATIRGTIDDYVPLTQKGAPLGVATLDASGFVPASQLDIDVSGDINAAISSLIDGAPGVLDTLNELAAAIGDDADFATNIATSIAGKADLAHTHLLADVTDVTAAASELNILDGATLTTAELNFVAGVTSTVQTQLDGKAATVHTHAISDVTNLQTELDGKATSSHTHLLADITDYVEPAGTTLSDTAPASPAEGDRWVKTTTWQEYIYFDGFWVEI